MISYSSLTKDFYCLLKRSFKHSSFGRIYASFPFIGNTFYILYYMILPRHKLFNLISVLLILFIAFSLVTDLLHKPRDLGQVIFKRSFLTLEFLMSFLQQEQIMLWPYWNSSYQQHLTIFKACIILFVY